MKKLLIASIILFAISCKKETPESPTPTGPVVVIDTTNYMIVDGDGHNTDTIALFQSLSAHWQASIGATALHGSSGADGINVMPYSGTVGHFTIVEHLPSTQATGVTLSGTQYYNPNVSVHIKKYESIGGKINCSYSGTFKKASDTTVVITVSGNFHVTRGNDL